MNEWQQMVREFHRKFGQPAPRRPKLGDSWNRAVPLHRMGLRVSLMREELDEFEESERACTLGCSPTPMVDALVDLLYVTIGTAVELGVDLDPHFREVHRTNMLKEGGATRADGKILKPEGWQPPDIEGILRRQMKDD